MNYAFLDEARAMIWLWPLAGFESSSVFHKLKTEQTREKSKQTVHIPLNDARCIDGITYPHSHPYQHACHSARNCILTTVSGWRLHSMIYMHKVTVTVTISVCMFIFRLKIKHKYKGGSGFCGLCVLCVLCVVGLFSEAGFIFRSQGPCLWPMSHMTKRDTGGSPPGAAAQRVDFCCWEKERRGDQTNSEWLTESVREASMIMIALKFECAWDQSDDPPGIAY